MEEYRPEANITQVDFFFRDTLEKDVQGGYYEDSNYGEDLAEFTAMIMSLKDEALRLETLIKYGRLNSIEWNVVSKSHNLTKVIIERFKDSLNWSNINYTLFKFNSTEYNHYKNYLHVGKAMESNCFDKNITLEIFNTNSHISKKRILGRTKYIRDVNEAYKKLYPSAYICNINIPIEEAIEFAESRGVKNLASMLISRTDISKEDFKKYLPEIDGDVYVESAETFASTLENVLGPDPYLHLDGDDLELLIDSNKLRSFALFKFSGKILNMEESVIEKLLKYLPEESLDSVGGIRANARSSDLQEAIYKFDKENNSYNQTMENPLIFKNPNLSNSVIFENVDDFRKQDFIKLYHSRYLMPDMIRMVFDGTF